MDLDPPMTTGQGTDELLLVPVRELVLFPGVVLPLLANRPGLEATLQEAARTSRTLAVAASTSVVAVCRATCAPTRASSALARCKASSSASAARIALDTLR